jgi:hypothetical protein
VKLVDDLGAKIMARSKKVVEGTVWEDAGHKIIFGRLEPLHRHKPKVENLFWCIGEKLPFGCLSAVHQHIKSRPIADREGVYVAHDAFGVPRYGGRGKIFTRLRLHKRKYPNQLAYFSFYIVRPQRGRNRGALIVSEFPTRGT